MRPIKTLANAGELVDLLAREGELSPAEISEQLDMPRPSVYRLIEGLSTVGLVESLDGSLTKVSLRWLHLGDRARSAITEWGDYQASLSRLVKATGYTAYFVVQRGHNAVCLGWDQGKGIGVLALRPGGSMPLNASAAGRVLLAYGEGTDEFLANGEKTAFTSHTLVTKRELQNDILKTQELGYALSQEDVTLGIAAVGVPVRKPGLKAHAALSIAGLAADLELRVGEFAELLKHESKHLVQ